MRAAACSIAALALGATIVAGAAAPQGAAPRSAASPETQRQIIDTYCLGCHSERAKTGGLSLERLDLTRLSPDAETWEKVIRKVRLGVMPPPLSQGAARRPEKATLDGLASWLEASLDAAAAATPHPGRPALHRLNRAEYANAIRDLLGLDVDVTTLLPADNSAFGFDNIADTLGSSPALLQAYLAAARKISAIAVGDPRVDVAGQTYTARQDLSQGHHLDGLPLGTVGGMAATHTFPTDGDYDFQLRLWRTNLSAMRGLEYPHDVELALDGQRILLATIGGDEDLVALQKNPTAASDAIEAQRLRLRVRVKAGQRRLTAAFLDETPATLQTARLQPFIRDFDNPFGAERAPHVQSITVTGPFNASPGQPPAASVFTCRPRTAAGEPACARRIATTLARRAYRRPLASAEVDTLVAAYTRERAGGSFEMGVEAVLRRILASPSFVFRPEAEPGHVAPGASYAIAGLELASRLSFFLWSSIPDAELLDAAIAGRLTRPAVLDAQVKRMLADRKAAALTENFAGQWLYLRNLRGIQPSTDLYPDFDDNLRQAFHAEAELFFSMVVREDRSVLDLLTSPDTHLNERLARHYGVPGIVGSRFRRVRLTDDARRGLLGKGAVLLATSHATTTSPVLRGKWVLDNILGAPPPAPPPDVPALVEGVPGDAPRTMREQIEKHRALATCANCHKLMDPIGFALENFDAVGAWRTRAESGAPLDTADVLASGVRVDGVASLRQALLERPEIFVQTLTEKLLTYALGRGLSPHDMPAVRNIVREARTGGYRFSAITAGITRSIPFRMRVKSTPVNTAE
jgi:cytochrome c553